MAGRNSGYDAFNPGGETRSGLVNTLISTRYAGTLIGHSDGVRSVDFALDGRTLATSSDDHSVVLWDVTDPVRPVLWDLTDRERPRQLGPPLKGSAGPVNSVVFAPDTGHPALWLNYVSLAAM